MFSLNIKKLEARKNIRRLLKALEKGDCDWKVRAPAAAALGRIGDTCAVEPLVAALHDQSHYVRRAAAEALGKIGDPGAVEPLVAVLKDRHVWIGSDKSEHQAAAEALTKLGVPDDANTRAWHAVAMRDWNAAIAFGTAALEPLVAVLERPDCKGAEREAAAAALGQIGDPGAVNSLVAILAGDRYDEQAESQAAATALGKIGDPDAVEPLVALLKSHTFKSRRKAAAAALGQIGDPGAVEPLVAVLKATDECIRETAAASLVRIGNPAVLVLVKALKHKSTKVRKAAAKSLGDIGDVRAIKPLFDGLTDPSVRLDESATQALATLYNNGNFDERSRLKMLAQDWQRVAWHTDHSDYVDIEYMDHQDGMTHWDGAAEDYFKHTDSIDD